MITKKGLMAMFAVGAVGVSACGGLLDVENPNNIVEEGLANVTAAESIVNGAFATVVRGHGNIIPVYSTLTDELFWIGSRDAWLQLDMGIMNDAANEFTDGNFPSVNEGRWMSDLAISSVEGFLADDAGNTGLLTQLARANLYSGISYMMIGTIFQDFVVDGDKKVSGSPVGPANMATVLQQAVTRMDVAVANASGDLLTDALLARARAKWELAAWSAQAMPAGTPTLISDAGADADAAAAIAAADPDYRLQFTFASGGITNNVGGQVNNRSELQWGERFVNNGKPDSINTIISIALMDPVDAVGAPYVQQYIIDEFSTQNEFAALTISSVRRMHLQLAESALASSDATGFATNLNNLRALDTELSPYGGGDDMNMLMYSRQANLILEGSRLGDLYRFGLQSDNWVATSPAVTMPGCKLTITNTEILANENVTGPSACL